MAPRICRVDAKQRHVGREIGQLLHREAHVFVVGVALDVGVELGRGKAAVHHVAFELGHVDAVGGETAHRLVKRGRDVADLEDEGGHHPGTAAPRQVGFARHHEETGGVVRPVLDMADKDAAIEILNEVIDSGNEEQRDEAKKLLESIA